MGTAVCHNKAWYDLQGGAVEQEFTVTGGTAYVVGGDAITQGDTNNLMGSYYGPAYANPFTLVQFFDYEPRTDGFTIALDKTNAKFIMRLAAGTEGTAGSDMSTKTWTCRIRYFDHTPFFI